MIGIGIISHPHIIMKKHIILTFLFICCCMQIQTQKGFQIQQDVDDVEQSVVNKNIVYNTFIYYAVNDAQIRAESIPTMNLLLEVLSEYPQSHILIEGWTDDTGNKEQNNKISLKRAELLKQYLVNCNITPHRISYKGMGCDETVANSSQARYAEVKVIVSPERRGLIYP